MADTPSSILLLRLQATGENTNLWGGYLNTALQTLERSSAGYQSLAVTGDATISWTNYSASNSGAVKTLKLTGTLTADATLTLPTYHNFLLVWNAAGDDVTIKCSGGTGIQIPNNRKALLFCDGTDYYSASPSYMPDNITEANDRDYMDKAAVSAAITALVGATTAGLVLISAADTTSGYLNGKLAAGSGISLTDSGAGNSTLTAALNINGLTAETSAADADAIAVYDASAGANRKMTRANFLNPSVTFDGTGSTMVAGARYIATSNVTMTLKASPATGDWHEVGRDTTAGNVTVARNGQTIESAAEDLTIDVNKMIVRLAFNGTTWKLHSVGTVAT